VECLLEFPYFRDNTDQRVSFIKASAEKFTSLRKDEKMMETNCIEVLEGN
jgi:hypothetical protein